MIKDYASPDQIASIGKQNAKEVASSKKIKDKKKKPKVMVVHDMEDLEDIERNQKKCIVLLTKKVYKEMMKLQI